MDKVKYYAWDSRLGATKSPARTAMVWSRPSLFSRISVARLISLAADLHVAYSPAAGSFSLRKGCGEGLLNSLVDDPQRHTSRYPLSLGKCQQVVEDHLDGSAFILPD